MTAHIVDRYCAYLKDAKVHSVKKTKKLPYLVATGSPLISFFPES